MSRWKYGNYEFKINPNSYSERVRLEGDNVRTLTGALISQPTALMESYSVSTVFYQPRTRILSTVSIENGDFIKYSSNIFYVLNKTNDRIDTYNSNMVFINSISLSSITDKGYVAFDVQSDYIWIYSSSTTDSISKMNYSGVLISNTVMSNAKDVTGIRVMSGYVWILKFDGSIDKVRLTDFILISTIALPVGLYFYGISSIDNYLLVGSNDGGKRTIYHIDSVNGLIVNSIIIDDAPSIDDITYDGNLFYILDNQKLYIVKGNTVEHDLYRLEREIDGNSFVNLIDDMGVSRRVQVGEFSKSRKLGYENMYDISMSITKINRG